MEENKEFLLTQEGYDKLEEELENLKVVKRKEVAERIKVAISFGDLSENAEYDEAKKEQAQVEERILKLENMVRKAVIIDESKIDLNVVTIGSIVKVKDLEFDEEVEIIFMTSYPEYMQKGYEVRAYRYLLKPIKEDDIRNNIISLIELLKVERSKYLCISTKDNIHRIAINSIVYIETERPNLIINTISSSYKSKITMKNIETYLNDYNFFRCHKSYLINLMKVNMLDIENNIVFINQNSIIVSRYKIKLLREKLNSCLVDVII